MKSITQSKHKKLITDIQKIIARGKAAAAQAAAEVLTESYWLIGERLAREYVGSDVATMQAHLEDVSEGLGMDVSTLKRCIYFFQAYKSAPRGTNLTWTHYKALLPLPEAERKWYEDQASKNKWTGVRLREAIKNDRFRLEAKLPATATIDVTPLKRPTDATYVYAAIVEKVVDGDTLLVRIDLGFTVWKEQRIRLAGIDCAPLKTAKGQKATDYVKKQLSQTEFVIIKTNKIDIYGRYVGHVFYSLSELSKAQVFEKGRYLNQELLGKGLAKNY